MGAERHQGISVLCTEICLPEGTEHVQKTRGIHRMKEPRVEMVEGHVCLKNGAIMSLNPL